MIALQLVAILLLAAVSMTLAGVEAAFYLVKRRRLGHIASQNSRAELANAYLADPPSLLMPIHMGAYTAHVSMTILTTSLLLDLVAHWALLVALGILLGYLFLFRLTLPYWLVRRNPERALLLLLPPFHLYAQALAPLITALRKRGAGEAGAPTGEDGTGAALPELPPPPVLDEDETRIAESLDRFAETQVREVMTPRPDIVAVQADACVENLRDLFRESLYSRIPAYGDNLDDIVGVVTVRDLVEYDGDPRASLRPLVRPAMLVPETKRISALLRELQASGTTLAVVIDEYGGTAGLVSVEDIVEELVGEIKDEYDEEIEPLVVEPDGAILVAGRLSLDRLEEALEAPVGEGSDVDTAGGLVTSVFGRIPRAGEIVDYQGFRIEVLDAERKRVNRVRIRRATGEPPA